MRLGGQSGQDLGVWAFESEPGPLPARGRCYEWLRAWASQQRSSLPQACTSSSRFRGREAAGGLIVRVSAAQLLAQDPSSGCCCPEEAG